MKSLTGCCLLLGLSLLFVSAAGAQEKAAKSSSLADYVAKPDDSFAWKERRRGETPAGDWVELTITSQTWRSIPWKHQLFILKPKKMRDASQALLVIAGGNWKPELEAAPGPEDKIPGQAMMFAAAAEQIGSPVAVILQVPEQPLFDGQREDQLISYTFEQYFRTKDDTWPLLLPMVKSASAGMTAVEQYAKREWSLDVKEFTVTGGSKRGWTTWLTAAVDPRVKALAPAVIDMLNLGKQMDHQVASWGKPSEQIRDYTERGLDKLLRSPQGEELARIVDPFHYRDRLKQPKLIILGTNDRYWPLDALSLYWSELTGQKYILYVPNHGHGISDVERLVGSITALHRQAAGEIELAELDWKFVDVDGAPRLRLHSNVAPKSVVAWTTEAKTRDFRDAKWVSQEMQPIEAPAADGLKVYEFKLPLKDTGFQAMFGEAVFDTDRLPYYLSTNVNIFDRSAVAVSGAGK